MIVWDRDKVKWALSALQLGECGSHSPRPRKSATDNPRSKNNGRLSPAPILPAGRTTSTSQRDNGGTGSSVDHPNNNVRGGLKATTRRTSAIPRPSYECSPASRTCPKSATTFRAYRYSSARPHGLRQKHLHFSLSRSTRSCRAYCRV